MKLTFLNLNSSINNSFVNPYVFPVGEISFFKNLLNKVDLPEFGLPIMTKLIF